MISLYSLISTTDPSVFPNAGPKIQPSSSLTLMSDSIHHLNSILELVVLARAIRWYLKPSSPLNSPSSVIKTCGAEDKSVPGFIGSTGRDPSLPSLMCFLSTATSIMKTSNPRRDAQTAVATAPPTLRYSLLIAQSCSLDSSQIIASS
jgi:hypothetical protein